MIFSKPRKSRAITEQVRFCISPAVDFCARRGSRVVGLQVEDELEVFDGLMGHAQQAPGSPPSQQGLDVGPSLKRRCAVQLRILIPPNLDTK